MGHNAGKITAPVNTDDVGAVLGLSSHDVATLCSYSRINIASKNKPIRVDQPQSLSDAQRYNQGNGIYYGIRFWTNDMYPWNLDSTSMLEYLNVRAGTDWARLDDFVGYDDNAMFNPTASVDDVFLIDGTDKGTYVNLLYWESLPDSYTGIDLFPILKQYTNGNDLGTYYPCALIKRPNGSKAIRALINKRKGLYTTIKYNNEFFVDWQIPEAPSSWNLNANQTLYATIFFIKEIVNTAQSWNIRDSWKDVTNTLISPFPLWGCPSGKNIPLTVKSLVSRGMEVTTVIGIKGGSAFTANWQWLSDAENGVTYTMTVTIRSNSGSLVGSNTISVKYTGQTNTGTRLIAIEASGLASGITSGTYRYYFSVKNDQNGDIVVHSGSGTFTVS